MKIAFLMHGIYEYASGSSDAVGGAERDQWLLGAALARFGWSVVVGVRNGLEPGERKTINGVQFVGVDRGQILLTWYRFLSIERPDWLFWECATHLWGPTVAIAKLLGVRTIFSAGLDRDVKPHRALIARPRCWPLYAWGLSKSDRIFVQHGGQLAELRPQWRSKASILPKVCVLPGVIPDQAPIAPHVDRNKYVAWVAMLRQPKRPDVLVKVAQKMPNTRFIVCGGSTTYMTPSGYCEEVIKAFDTLPNIDYRGQVAPEEAEQVIANAAVLFCTSDEEGFPNTFTQAWSSGTPIVTLRIDPDRIIERVGLGALSGNLDRAVADLSLLLDSPERREAIASRARQFIADNYSAAAVVNLFERALQTKSKQDATTVRESVLTR